MPATVFLARWNGGWAERSSPSEIVAYGRNEVMLGLGALSSLAEVYRVCDKQLAIFASPRESAEVGVHATGIADDAYLAYDVGDSITAPNSGGLPTLQRVHAITVTEDNESGRASVAVTLNDVILPAEARLMQAIKKMVNGTQGGRSKVAQPTALNDELRRANSTAPGDPIYTQLTGFLGPGVATSQASGVGPLDTADMAFIGQIGSSEEGFAGFYLVAVIVHMNDGTAPGVPTLSHPHTGFELVNSVSTAGAGNHRHRMCMFVTTSRLDVAVLPPAPITVSFAEAGTHDIGVTCWQIKGLGAEGYEGAGQRAVLSSRTGTGSTSPGTMLWQYADANDGLLVGWIGLESTTAVTTWQAPWVGLGTIIDGASFGSGSNLATAVFHHNFLANGRGRDWLPKIRQNNASFAFAGGPIPYGWITVEFTPA